MDRDVENFNTRLRTIKIWELTIGIIIALILSIILMFIFPIFETNDDAFMLLLLTLILVFFIWCLIRICNKYNFCLSIFVFSSCSRHVYWNE